MKSKDANIGRLILERKRGEAIVIDGPAEVQIIATARGRVKVLVTADKSVKVLRKEIAHDPK